LHRDVPGGVADGDLEAMAAVRERAGVERHLLGGGGLPGDAVGCTSFYYFLKE
jgi:hypothetical protein